MKKLGYTILLGGLLLRILIFYQNRSLFIDEANLARNIAERSFAALFQNLDYDQYAPPLFSSIVKIFTSVFGATEMAFRVFPLLCSMASLWVFYLLVKRFCKVEAVRWFPFVLMTFSLAMVEYATELKQYSCDVLVALGLLYFASDKRFLWFENSPKVYQKYWFWLVIGILVIWFSMPSIFVLAAIGIYFGVKSLQSKLKTSEYNLLKAESFEKRLLLKTTILGVAWLGSFGLYYFLILQHDIGDDNLKGYHGNYFFPILPTSLEDLDLQWRLIRQFLGGTFGSTALAIGYGLISILVGIAIQFRLCKRNLWLLVFPLFLMVLASSFELYSLKKRLTLFSLPSLMLLASVGTAWLYQQCDQIVQGQTTRNLFNKKNILKAILFLILIIISVNQKTYRYIVEPFQKEELRPLLYSLKTDIEKFDVVFVHYEAVPAYSFYTKNYKNKSDFDFLQKKDVMLFSWGESGAPKMINLAKNQQEKTLILFSHTSKKEIDFVVEKLKSLGNLELLREVEGSSCYIFNPTD